MGGSWTASDVAGLLRRPTATDDKYSRGVLGIRTGSELYPGAAVLGVEAAWRTGVGMVRYVGAARDLVLQRRPETVTQDGRVQAWLIGSGTDASARRGDETHALRAILAGDVPVVVDAGALDLVVGATAPLVVTPHAREHAKLRSALGLGEYDAADPDSRARAAAETAAALGGAVLLKGSATVVAAPSGWSTVVEAGTPWLATAGTGDVLGGVVGALVAGAADDGSLDAERLARLAASGAWLHGHAANLAAAAAGKGGGPITALDVADALPRAVAEVLAGG
ncbi:NAD(P)H-hydrate dehydratase [Microbacterium sp. 4R-513]|uniref:ADP-dependent NAD(P)H-hydrate dehydratase n=1 Tax=Microbacterium sp. 4R-513 TaxID=2567934 RepID=UPI0013E1273E|nr:ADP/ATP-dependent (S)-NAD(P)H-hydrate dehydratase [Microbacterium sp. 4R-513]QIG38254.1 NAD(P)H-hydrate dehydratase [Microbacterium sp. 4R-513]